MMTLKERVLEALSVHADETGEVSGTFQHVKQWVGPDAASWDIHTLLVHLREDGAFRGTPMMTAVGDFNVTLEGVRTARERVLDALRGHADASGAVAGTLAAIKTWIGPDAERWDIQRLLIQLGEDGAFHGTPMLTQDSFNVTLAE